LTTSLRFSSAVESTFARAVGYARAALGIPGQVGGTLLCREPEYEARLCLAYVDNSSAGYNGVSWAVRWIAEVRSRRPYL